jgi:putative ABC transport system permease protein
MLMAPWPREVVAAALSQRVSSAMTLLFVLGATATVLITAGRSVGAEAAILAEVDAVGTRTLTIRTTAPHDDFSSLLVDRLAAYGDVVDEVTGFGAPVDITAMASGGRPVAMRTVYGSLSGDPVVPLTPLVGQPQAIATSDALTTLGLLAGRGTVYDSSGTETLITNRVTLPAHLAWMEPTVLIPSQADTQPLSVITVVAREPADLPLVTSLVTAALVDVDPETITLETSEQLAELRGVIDGQLTTQSHRLVLGILVACGFATLVNVWSLVLMRRRDFGRRRALGATRTMIVMLLSAQVAVISLVGALIGVTAGVAVLFIAGDPLPTVDYMVAVGAAFATTTTFAASLPALWAANRDPLTELRVP